MIDQELTLIPLVVKAKDGDTGAFDKILEILDPDIKKLSTKYYISGSDPQDVLQECRIGVWKAVRDYSVEGGMSFKNFSINLCCKRHIITAMAHANRKKFDLHNNSVSLDSPVITSEDDLQQTLADFIQDKTMPSMLESIIFQEEFTESMRRMECRLTPLETNILTQYAQNDSYKEIATSLGCKSKTVDNALMRIRKKAAEVYRESEIIIESVVSFGNTSMNSIYDFVGVMSTNAAPPRPRFCV